MYRKSLSVKYCYKKLYIKNSESGERVKENYFQWRNYIDFDLLIKVKRHLFHEVFKDEWWNWSTIKIPKTRQIKKQRFYQIILFCLVKQIILFMKDTYENLARTFKNILALLVLSAIFEKLKLKPGNTLSTVTTALNTYMTITTLHREHFLK